MGQWSTGSQARTGSFSEPAGGGVADASNDGYYHVWFWPGGKSECECAAYRVFGKGCKHITAVKESIRKGAPTEGVISFFGGSK